MYKPARAEVWHGMAWRMQALQAARAQLAGATAEAKQADRALADLETAIPKVGGCLPACLPAKASYSCKGGSTQATCGVCFWIGAQQLLHRYADRPARPTNQTCQK
jgi:hypothetical protein